MHNVDVVLDSPEYIGADDLFSGLQNDVHRLLCRIRVACEIHVYTLGTHVTLKFVETGVDNTVAVPFCLVHIIEL